LLVAELAEAGNHHHHPPEVEAIGAANADGASNPQIKPLKARYLKAVITNLLFAQQPRAAVLAAQRQLPRSWIYDKPNLRELRLRS
jgi:hypothetical protein